jgi:2-keto-4-pentenoate hydratase/2-oxohepta-3-ene-1,7-dioic acid hydratase in catechol pathway
MRRTSIVLGLVFTLFGGYRSAVTQPGPKPFKLGTFERSGEVFLGVVLDDSQVIDLAQANAALESRDSAAPKIAMPSDMKELIGRYETELKARVSAIASEVAAARSTPAYVYAIADVKILPPLQPSLILNAGGNYREHEQGIAQQRQQSGAGAAEETPSAVSAPGIWERNPGDTRSNPYLFLKSPTVVIGPNDPIRMPPGRDHIDFECEFNVVVGKQASHVPTDRASDYIFGYTIQIDVSDRGGRGDRKMGGSDWLVGKNHDTFAPLGPFIVPKEFVSDPMNVKQTFTLNGKVMQDSNTSRMTHNVYELLHYASNILTLHPGDLISGGSPAGTNIERSEPRWMRPGDTAVCSIEGLGVQTHPVVAATTSQTSQ